MLDMESVQCKRLNIKTNKANACSRTSPMAKGIFACNRFKLCMNCLNIELICKQYQQTLLLTYFNLLYLQCVAWNNVFIINFYSNLMV